MVSITNIRFKIDVFDPNSHTRTIQDLINVDTIVFNWEKDITTFIRNNVEVGSLKEYDGMQYDVTYNNGTKLENIRFLYKSLHTVLSEGLRYNEITIVSKERPASLVDW